MGIGDEVLRGAREFKSGVIGTIDHVSKDINTGLAYGVSEFANDLAAGAVFEIEGIPAADYEVTLHPESIFSVAAPVEFTIFEGCAPETGKHVESENYNRVVSAALGTTVDLGHLIKDRSTASKNVTVTAGGVLTLETGTWADLFESVSDGQYIYYDDDGTPKILYISDVTGAALTLLEADGVTVPTLTAVGVAAAKDIIITLIGARVTCSATNTMVFAAADDSITLASGHENTWRDLGFKGRDQIYIAGTTSNNGLKTSTYISHDERTIYFSDSLTDETINTAVDVDFQIGPDGRLMDRFAVGSEGKSGSRTGGTGTGRQFVLRSGIPYMLRVKNIHASAASDVYVNIFFVGRS